MPILGVKYLISVIFIPWLPWLNAASDLLVDCRHHAVEGSVVELVVVEPVLCYLAHLIRNGPDMPKTRHSTGFWHPFVQIPNWAKAGLSPP